MKYFSVIIIFIVLLFSAYSWIQSSQLFNERARQWAEIDYNDPKYYHERTRLKWLRSESQSEFEERMKHLLFYRVTASYSHKDRNTGEIEKINFDVVALCNAVFMDPKGLTVSRESPVPAFFGKTTKDGGLVNLRIPKACVTSNVLNDEIPNDLTPFVIWHDDVTKMGHGLGFATEDAYESPVAPLKFHGASITRSTFEEWQEWREEQLKQFKPVGFLQSPWGISGSGNQSELQFDYNNWPEKSGWGDCKGAARVFLPAEVQERLKTYWPDGKEDFWFYQDLGLNIHQVTNLLDSKNYKGGAISAATLENYAGGILTRSREGAISFGYRSPSRYPAEIYPVLRKINTYNNGKKTKIPDIVYRDIDFRAEMKGFVSCGRPTYHNEVKAEEFGYVEGSGIYVAGKQIWERDLSSKAYPKRFTTKWIFEGTEYVWRWKN